MMTNNYLPRKARCRDWRERGQLIVLGAASIYDGLITVVSLGYLTTDIRAWLLFDVFEED
jgi:hypothetical protein